MEEQHGPEQVIASTINYILNQHSTTKVFADAMEGDEDRYEDYHHLQGAMAAWAYTLQAIQHFISIHMFEEEEDEAENRPTSDDG